MGQQINAKLSHKKPDICEMSQTGNEISFLLFRNFPQEEIHETEFHLTSFVCVPIKKKKMAESFTIAKHYHYLTESLRGAGIYSMSWKEVNTTHAKQSL